VIGKLLIIVVALAACGSDCSVDCPGQGVRFSLPQVPASTSTVRICISEACSPPRDVEHLERFEPNRTGVSFKIGDRVPVRVDALDDRGNVVASVSGVSRRSYVQLALDMSAAMMALPATPVSSTAAAAHSHCEHVVRNDERSQLATSTQRVPNESE
jgi:hypothetical protein